ncbi:Pentatricopeptide repeat-containing protein [Apostasia shenzhenica]|uniref:Pentatricopeptide repeat-containing protein n=1 Tax=Apostasia shenzhenica TaxID=1088818 RepID=A0A2I0A419_9ASPA|nr:Pentatricopeptide repeat-containing protein [Apostasia shenzhenica]
MLLEVGDPTAPLPSGEGLWSPEERLCLSLFRRISSSPPSSCSHHFSSILQIHAFLLRRSLDANLPLLTLLISSLSGVLLAGSAAALRHAVRAFNRRPAQDTLLCNAMIRALVQNGKFSESLELYGHLRRSPPPLGSPIFYPDTYTFPFLLKSCAAFPKSVHRREGSQLHGQITRMGFVSNVFVSTGLVDMLVKSGDIQCATKVFDDMPERSIATWTAIAIGYGRKGETEAAMELFRSMPQKDLTAFNALIDIFVKSGDMDSAQKLFYEMPNRNVVSWTTLLSGYCKHGDMDSAVRLFDEMPEKNLFSWNVMIGGFCRCRQPDKAMEFFRDLQSDSCRFDPDEITLLSIIPAIADLGAMDLARWIHSYARRKELDQSTVVSNALVDMYAKCGEVVEARKVFDSIPIKETVSWNALINGLAVNGRASEALEAFMEMLRSGFSPSEVTMIGVFSACSHGGLVEEGRRWFAEMEKLGVEKTVAHYGCMVDLLGRKGFLEEAESLVKKMSVEPNGIILSSLLFACHCQGDVSRAERVMKMAAEVEPGNVQNYVMMRNLYALAGRWGEVKRMMETMRRFGGKEEAGCSAIEVGRKVWEFVAADGAHPEREKIYGVLRDLQGQVKGEKDEEDEEDFLI